MIKFSSTEVFKRLRQLEGVSTNKELANRLGVNEKTLSGWQTKNTIPLDTLLEFANRYEASVDWLLTGESKGTELDEMEQLLLNNYKQLDPIQKLQLLNASQGNIVESVVQNVGNGSHIANLAGGSIHITK
ncbi:hypothetical protein B0186_04815 [Canicola haemoglobinophilus]|uniref:Bacteriophage ci repressor protein n=1 Tax=Canicola haemoglobinophilus TaxID=733 RepID=A0A1V4B1Q6_9PAST|nr:helix-turn-helix domain-containing protein [Canicola haemoglobinophilus]OOS01062.1 hypothetical protein B0186_04815 [Canicola haemoglobinophilus]STO60299.1 bacteriophage ci repressor protein [Canicola haemoglobinophilus]